MSERSNVGVAAYITLERAGRYNITMEDMSSPCKSNQSIGIVGIIKCTCDWEMLCDYLPGGQTSGDSSTRSTSKSLNSGRWVIHSPPWP